MNRNKRRAPHTTTYALVFWTETNEISVLDARCVIDASMLPDPEKEGMVEFGEPSITAPPGGWPRFRARVLAVADNEVELRKMEDDFIENGTMSFNTKGQETNNNTTTTSKRKRQKPSAGGTSKSSTNSDSGYETRTKRNISLDKQELLQRITVLESQLVDEQRKNEQLLRLNLQLQEGLPKLIEEALNKKSLAVAEVNKEAEKVVETKPIPETAKAACSTTSTVTTTTITPTVTNTFAAGKQSHPSTNNTTNTNTSTTNSTNTTTVNSTSSISANNTNGSTPEPIQNAA